MSDRYDAFLLVSFGGPERPDDVMPFLENVTRGRDVPRARLEAVAHHYLELGGVSPINEQNRALLASLTAAFAERDIGLPLYWGNRNWAPTIPDALASIHAAGHRRVLALVTSAYSSYSGCRQYREDLAAGLEETGLAGALSIDRVRQYFDHPGFVRPFAEGLAGALARLADEGIAPALTRVLFSTHSIPQSMADASGPAGGPHGAGGAYVAQHRATMELALSEVQRPEAALPPARLVYQSRSGSPMTPWLEPDISDAIRTASAEGARAVVIVPIGFVSDHVEVIWDLDHEARETADALGVRLLRVATPGTHPAFVGGLVDLVEERLTGRPAAALSALGPWPSVCAVDCCAGRGLPTVSGADEARRASAVG
jgi:ferrochelatase